MFEIITHLEIFFGKLLFIKYIKWLITKLILRIQLGLIRILIEGRLKTFLIIS